MTQITIICIGKTKDKNIACMINEFLKRMGRFYRIKYLELKEESPEKESEKLGKYLSPETYSCGIAESIKKKSKLISLSKMTFTHEMARLFLIEQIYRSYMINNNKGWYQK